MIDFWEEIGDALDAGQPVDDIIPYDLRGFTEGDTVQLLSIMITYGADPERVRTCKEKLKELFKCTRETLPEKS